MVPTGSNTRSNEIPAARKGRLRLLGLGKDGSAGHMRMTSGDHFFLQGGEEQTHQRMQDLAVKLFQRIRDLGYSPDSITRAEYEQVLLHLQQEPNA